MSLTVAELNTKLTADIRDLQRGLTRAQGDIDTFAGKGGSTLGSFGKKVVGAFAVKEILDFGMAAVKAASNLEESLNKSNTVFGQSAGVIRQWAEGAATDFGLSQRAALDAAGTFGNLFVQLGFGADEAANVSQQMTELAADFASFHNADIESVIVAQTAAFRGEYDALQRFLPLINAATVEQKAMEMTGKANAKALTAQEKAAAVTALMFEGAGDAAGDFDRTSGGLANQQRTLTARIEDAQAALGKKLQPVMLEVVSWLNTSGIPGFLKFAVVVGEGITDAAAFAIGGLADLASGVAQVLEKVDQFIPKMEGVPEHLKRGVAELREMEAGLHDVQINLEMATGSTEDNTQATRASLTPTKDAAAAAKAHAEAADEAQDALVKYKDAQINLRDANQAVTDSQYDLTQAQKEYDDLLASGGVDVEKVRDAQKDLVQVQRDLEDALNDVVTAQKAVDKALEPAAPRDLAKAQRGLEDANDDVTKAGISLRDAQADLNDLQASGKATADELTSAQIRVNDAHRAVKDAEDRVIEAQDDLNNLQKQGTIDSDAYKDASGRLHEAQTKAEEITAKFHTAQDNLNQAQAVAPDHADKLRDAQNKLREATDQAKDAVWAQEKATTAVKEAQRLYNEALANTPKNVTTSVTRNETVQLTTNETRNVQKVSAPQMVSTADGFTWVAPNFVGPLQSGMARLPKVGPYTPSQRVAAEMMGLPVLHQGGVVPGPRGAEVPIMAQAGERVIPANQAGGGGGGGGGGQPIVVQLVADGRIIQEILLGHQRRSGSLGFN